MSGRIVEDVLEHAPDLPDTEWRVLIVLARDANDRDRIARYCSTEVIARQARRAPGTVRNAVAALVTKGLIKPLLQAHRGRVQHYEIARLDASHRFVTYADNGSTHRPDKRRKRVSPLGMTLNQAESVTTGNDT